MDKRIALAVAGIALVAGAFIVRGFVSPSQGSESDSYEQPELAAHYQAFMKAAPVDVATAKSALDSAEKEDPTNGYTDYLRASLFIKENDLASATSNVVKGNEKDNTIHYVEEGPAHEGMFTLNQMRRLSAYSGDIEDADPEQAEAYFQAVQDAGYRVAQMTPVTSLTLATGVSMIKNVQSGAIAYYQDRDETKLAEWKTWEAKFAEWDATFKDQMAEATGDVIREAIADLDLTEDEIMQVVYNQPLADKSKQKVVDERFEEILKREQEVLLELAKSILRPEDQNPT